MSQSMHKPQMGHFSAQKTGPLLKSDTAIQRYSDTRSRSRSIDRSHA